MAIYPGVQYRPLAARQTQPRMTAHDIVCLHTMVGTLTSTDRMFKANGWRGTESHFGIGGKWGDGLDGVVYQWQDTDFSADANLEGNHRVISIETGDNFPRLAADIEPWTAKQLDAIVAVTAWACRKYNIPPVLIPDSKPGRRGIGYHRLGVQHHPDGHPAGWLQPGGERWSEREGKECPTRRRIEQIPEIVARVKIALSSKTTQREDEMSNPFMEDHKLTAADIAAYGRPDFKVGQAKKYDEIVRFSPSVARLRREVAAGFAANQAALDAVLKAVLKGGPISVGDLAAVMDAAEKGAAAALAKLTEPADTAPEPE
jgi:hypothetical protein